MIDLLSKRRILELGALHMIWIVVHVHSGITHGVEAYADEATARRRLVEIQTNDFDWSDDDLSLFAGEIGSEFERLYVEAIDADESD
jgi:hypothetical protein